MAIGPAWLTSSFVWMQGTLADSPSLSAGEAGSLCDSWVPQTQAERPCVSHDQHPTCEAGSLVEVMLWNLLSQDSPVTQSPSDRGTTLLQGLLGGAESEERQL